MNLHLILRRLRLRRTLLMGAGSTIAAAARILNAGRSDDCIRIGASSRIEGELFVFAHGGRITIGDWCFVGPGTRIWSAAEIRIGHRVLISHSCNVMDSLTHPLDAAARHAQFKAILTRGHPISLSLDEQPVRIDNDAWIGASATILRGVRIGAGAIVGAGAVVTKDVAPRTLVAGNPARVIRQLDQEACPP